MSARRLPGNCISMGRPPHDIAELISKARAADSQALARLLELYRNYLRLLARTGIDAAERRKADPSDLVQETMFKASQHFAGFRGQTEAELAAWLRQILAQCLVDHARRYRASGRTVARERSIHDLLNRSSVALSALVAQRAETSHGLPRGRDAGLILAEAMAELSDDYREVSCLASGTSLLARAVRAVLPLATSPA